MRRAGDGADGRPSEQHLTCVIESHYKGALAGGVRKLTAMGNASAGTEGINRKSPHGIPFYRDCALPASALIKHHGIIHRRSEFSLRPCRPITPTLIQPMAIAGQKLTARNTSATDSADVRSAPYAARITARLPSTTPMPPGTIGNDAATSATQYASSTPAHGIAACTAPNAH